MNNSTSTHGYYHVKIHSAAIGQRLLASNDERAFIISRLQDLLSPRAYMRQVPPNMQVAVCIDLLAYSIHRQSIDLLVFAIDRSLLEPIGAYLIRELTQYRDTVSPWSAAHASSFHVGIQRLRGPHHALATSLMLHAQHEDWEYDRYSSIGFFLHDRRGSWMRTWRLTELYGNSNTNYLLLMHAHIERAMKRRVSVASLRG